LHANSPGPNVRNHWLTLKLTGTKSNRDAFGARIDADSGDLHQMIENYPQSGYLSQNDPRPHLGIGPHTEVDVLTIRWPSGTVQTLQHVKADQILHVTEPRDGEPAAGKGDKQ